MFVQGVSVTRSFPSLWFCKLWRGMEILSYGFGKMVALGRQDHNFRTIIRRELPYVAHHLVMQELYHTYALWD